MTVCRSETISSVAKWQGSLTVFSKITSFKGEFESHRIQLLCTFDVYSRIYRLTNKILHIQNARLIHQLSTLCNLFQSRASLDNISWNFQAPKINLTRDCKSINIKHSNVISNCFLSHSIWELIDSEVANKWKKSAPYMTHNTLSISLSCYYQNFDN